MSSWLEKLSFDIPTTCWVLDHVASYIATLEGSSITTIMALVVVVELKSMLVLVLTDALKGLSTSRDALPRSPLLGQYPQAGLYRISNSRSTPYLMDLKKLVLCGPLALHFFSAIRYPYFSYFCSLIFTITLNTFFFALFALYV